MEGNQMPNKQSIICDVELVKAKLDIMFDRPATCKNDTVKVHVDQIGKSQTYMLGKLAYQVKDLNIKRSGKGVTIIVETFTSI